MTSATAFSYGLRIMACVAAAAGLGAAACPAAAAIITVQISGDVVSGPANVTIDTYGVFGAPGASLAGEAYSFDMTLDDAAPDALNIESFHDEGTPHQQLLLTELEESWREPSAMSIQLTVGGSTIDGASVAPLNPTEQNLSGLISRQTGFFTADGELTGIYRGVSSEFDISQVFQILGPNEDYHTSLDNPPMNGASKASFDFDQLGTPNGEIIDFNATSLKLTSVGAQAPYVIYDTAPEPQTWAMFALGVAALGGSLRRRRPLAS